MRPKQNVFGSSRSANSYAQSEIIICFYLFSYVVLFCISFAIKIQRQVVDKEIGCDQNSVLVSFGMP